MPARAKQELTRLITRKPLSWTEHAKYKMRQYGLSPTRVNRVLRFPVRTEKGIAPKTVAVMSPVGSHPLVKQSASPSAAHASVRQGGLRFSGTIKPADKFHAMKKVSCHEIWVMYQDTKTARKVIAAWRYPGVSPVREPPPFPEDILD